MELLTYWQGFCFFFFAFFCECYGQLVGHLLIMGSSVIPVTKLSCWGLERWMGEHFGLEILVVQLLLNVFIMVIHMSENAESEAVQIG